MFDATPRRAARIVFGLVLIASTLWISARAIEDSSRENDAAIAHAILTAWGVAFGAALASYALLKVWRVRFRIGLAPSLVVPSIGVILLLPITVHLIYFASTHRTDSFADWVKESVFLVGFAHVVCAGATAYRANTLARGDEGMASWTIYASTVAAANVPFPLIPSVIVAITGVFVVPVIWGLAPLARWERRSERVPAMVVI
ncbi:MAG: hypothetical protein QM831_46600 [Kofleriaceae bacterium]